MNRPDVGVVDYGVGNTGSVVNMFRRLGTEAVRVSDPETALSMRRILLPGVGAFDHGMRKLRQTGMDEALRARAVKDLPTLGICLGMQLLLDESEEGVEPGLGLIEGGCRRFRFENGSALKVPHMGWSHATPTSSHPLFAGLEEDNRFYFVHSYFAQTKDESETLATSLHGHGFASSVRKGNVFGTQFHPEKSHKYGMTLLQNFLEI